MIQVQSLVYIADNSGGKVGRCIHIYGKQKVAKPNDEILISIRKCVPSGQVKKGEMYRAIVVRTANWTFRNSGPIGFKFQRNAVILLNKRLLPLGSRFKGPIFQDIRLKQHAKLIALAPLLL